MSAISGSRDQDRYTNWVLSHYNYGPGTVVFDEKERAALRALIASSAILIAAAVVSFVLSIIKSWLCRNGRRNKTRLFMFVLLVVMIIASRAILISDVVDVLRGPNRTTRLYEYDRSKFLTRYVVIGLFSYISEIVLFFHILFEITRNATTSFQKHSLFEWTNTIVLSVLAVLGVIVWGYDTGYVLHDYYENYSFEMSWEILFGLKITYTILAVLFASEVVVVAAMKTIGKNGTFLLIPLAMAFWLGQVLDLSYVFVQAFGTSSLTYLSMISLRATAEYTWMAKLILLALLGWSTHRVSHAGGLRDTPIGKV